MSQVPPTTNPSITPTKTQPSISISTATGNTVTDNSDVTTPTPPTSPTSHPEPDQQDITASLGDTKLAKIRPSCTADGHTSSIMHKIDFKPPEVFRAQTEDLRQILSTVHKMECNTERVVPQGCSSR